MGSLIGLMNVLSLALSSPSNSFSNHMLTSLFEENNTISNYQNLDDGNNAAVRANASGLSVSVSESINDTNDYLNTTFSTYYWINNKDESGLTTDITGFAPIEVQSNGNYTDDEITEALQRSGAIRYSDYGGCGPIATLGVLDYFSRFFPGFNRYLPNVEESDGRIELATTLFGSTDYSFHFGDSDGNIFVFPDYCAAGFNTTAITYGVGDMISANAVFRLSGFSFNYLWGTITFNVDKGMPVSLVVADDCGPGPFSLHVTNVYGYETWVGIDLNTGESITKRFLKARINWGDSYSGDNYCDADILKTKRIGIITYSLNYRNTISFDASTFSSFVNGSGQGQYFFNTVQQEITLPNGELIYTNRLRTSYIENKYLVMSPNRKNAGDAYLDLEFFDHTVQKLSFSVSMWSGSEGTTYQTFYIEYYDYEINDWITLKTIDPSTISTNKSNPSYFTVYFPKVTYSIVFRTKHLNPTSDRNKGRICLDNFKAEYIGGIF